MATITIFFSGQTPKTYEHVINYTCEGSFFIMQFGNADVKRLIFPAHMINTINIQE